MHPKKSFGKETKKPSIFWNSLSSIFISIVALAVYVLQVMSPLHPVIALFLLYCVYRIVRKLFGAYFSSKKVSSATQQVRRFTFAHKVSLTFVVIGFTLWYTVTSVVPSDKQVFSLLPEAKQTEIVDEDVEVAAVLLDKLVLTGDTLMANKALAKDQLSSEDVLSLKHDWEQFYLATLETEQMTERHRYFPQIDVFTNRNTHIKSFIIAYSLYMKKFEIFHKVLTMASNHPPAVKIFNEYSQVIGASNLYDDVSSRYFASNSLLRRNLGYLYYLMSAPEDTSTVSPNYASLLNVSKTSYHYVFRNALSHVTLRGSVYKESFDRKAFETWLPIQKTVVTDKIGNIHVGDRTEKFITTDQIITMKQAMAPGDILVYRKNWYASNLGIPGFWTHVGLYTGTLDDMDVYFKDVFPYKGHTSVSGLLKATNPKAYETYRKEDKKGFVPSVVESQTHGTIIQSLEASAAVDYVAAVRTKLTKKEVLDGILLALSHYEQPYDYAFDLDTKQEIYCSELIYDAYSANSTNKGITLPLVLISGRNVVAPNAIVEKFAKEYSQPNAELTFVYFLDAREDTKRAFPSTAQVFIETKDRPKYSKLQQ